MTNDPITKLSDIPQKDKLAADMLRALGRGTVTPALRKQFLEAFPRMEDRKFNLKGTITGRTQGGKIYLKEVART